MTHNLVRRDRRAVIAWLSLCALMVACMVMVGGYTRLSGSGLSITQWKPIHGIFPPSSAAQWDEEFQAYQQSPQYKLVNNGMSLEEFKEIFLPEYLHRLLGRVAGMVFFLPLAFFGMRHSITGHFCWRLMIIFALGGLQGVIGWFMVKSGLVNDPHVSHLRLALHLAVAFGILGLIEWAILDIVMGGNRVENGGKPPAEKAPATTYSLWFILLCFQVILGAFMAGLHAGLFYNSWPMMNDQWLPEGLITDQPWYNNLTMIQFLHRITALLLPLCFLIWWYKYRIYVRKNRIEPLCLTVSLIIALQVFLGILTLLKAAALPIALTHQMTALFLFAASVALYHQLKQGHDY